MRYCLFIVLVLAGCGRPYKTGEFEPYVERFKDEMASRGVKLDTSVLVVERGNALGRAGMCVFMPTAQFTGVIVIYTVPTVSIDGIRWDQLSEPMREQLVFHELGHCLLHLPHQNDLQGPDPLDCAQSLMNTGMARESCYVEQRPHYLDVLVTTGIRTTDSE